MSKATDHKPHWSVGCVKFLNTRPLIDGLENDPTIRLVPEVPSRLLAKLESGEVDVALCPVVDYQLSRVPLRVIPAGGIGCDGQTLTVRLFSRIPLDQVDHLAADTDSHTSVMLSRIVLGELYGRLPAIEALGPLDDAADGPAAMLLIGDKVVTREPDEQDYPYQLDLGEAWGQLTGLPFVFAVWMIRQDRSPGDLPEKLAVTLKRNLGRVDAISKQYAPQIGWPTSVAEHYLGQLLRYEIGPRQLQAIEHFYHLAEKWQLITDRLPLQAAACGEMSCNVTSVE